MGRVERPQAGAHPDSLGALSLEQLMEHFGVPGVSVAVIWDFQIHWAKGYGIADVETGAPVTPETLFQAGSISKPVAAMAVLRAVEDGLFGLDDDINDILTSWRLPDGDFGSAAPVTPRTLTSHTSGLGDGFGYPGYDPDGPIPTIVQSLQGHELSNTGPVFRERPPMTFYEYSGGGASLMQLALSDARGRLFPDLMKEFVLDPIGMTTSTYEQPLPRQFDSHSARAHDAEGRSMGAKWHVYPEMAAAGLWTTPTDLARFAIEIQESARGRSNRVLSRAGVQDMLTPVGVGPQSIGFWIERRGEGWYFAHDGSDWGFEALLSAHKVKGYGLVIMTNATRGWELIEELARRIELSYDFDARAARVPRTYVAPPADGGLRLSDGQLAAIAGIYEFAATRIEMVAEDGRLRFHTFDPTSAPPESGPTELGAAESPTSFVLSGGRRVRFVLNDRGEVSDVLIERRGRVIDRGRPMGRE
jgi:CubicO group peptidase (beta-lactamase class C family)